MAILYLAAPLVLMLATWLPWWLGLPLATLTVMGTYPRHVQAALPRPRTTFLLCLTGMAYALLSGMSPLIISTGFSDMSKQYGIFNDLVRFSWPVTFPAKPGWPEQLLRYNLGMYLVPALLSKLWPHPEPMLMVLWMGLGVWLTLQLATATARNKRRLLWAAALILFLGGMDTWIMLEGYGPLCIFEAWGRFGPYGWMLPSHTSSFDLAPQHTIAGWLGGLLLWRHHDHPALRQHLLGIGGALAFWSALGSIGYFALMGLWLLRDSRQKQPLGCFTWQNAAMLPPLLMMALYYGLGDGVPKIVFTPAIEGAFSFLWKYAFFVSVEFAVLGWMLYKMLPRRRALLVCTLTILYALPCLFLGLAVNDLLCDASRPLWTILTLAVIEATDEEWEEIAHVVALLIIVTIGLYTGANSFARSLHEQNYGVYYGSIRTIEPKFLPQYVTRLPEGARKWGLLPKPVSP